MRRSQRGMLATLSVLVVLLLAALALMGMRAIAMAGWLAATAQAVTG